MAPGVGQDYQVQQSAAVVPDGPATGHVDSFRDLRTYQFAKMLAERVYLATRTFPREETYALTDQILRSSRSIGAQIAEAWGKRAYERSFVAKLIDANAEQMETQHWLDTAFSCGYLSDSTYAELIDICERIGRMIWRMVEKSAAFCKPGQGMLKEEQGMLKEEQPLYFVADDGDDVSDA